MNNTYLASLCDKLVRSNVDLVQQVLNYLSDQMTGAKSYRTFEGQSANGDIQEAIENAVELAKSELHTELVEWNLHKIAGQYGGIVGAKYLTVTIEVNDPDPSDAAAAVAAVTENENEPNLNLAYGDSEAPSLKDGGELPRGFLCSSLNF